MEELERIRAEMAVSNLETELLERLEVFEHASHLVVTDLGFDELEIGPVGAPYELMRIVKVAWRPEVP
jgi:hypothetical protein